MSSNTKGQWLLLAYKIAPEPAKNRVAVWRKIKGLGAVYLQNSVCLIPAKAEHQRQLKIIQNDITSHDGEALLMEATALDEKQEALVIRKFNEDRDADYGELISKCSEFIAEVEHEIVIKHFTYAELEENDQDVKKLRSWMDKIRKLDFYNSPRQAEAASKLARCEALLEKFTQSVFDAEHGTSAPRATKKQK
jgi:hypothetical protein